MIVNFKLGKLDSLLNDFYKVTGLTISVWDGNFIQLSHKPDEMIPFCRMIKATEKGAQRCYNCDKSICTSSSQSEVPVTHMCHAGMTDTALCLKFKDKILGYLMFGQAKDKNTEKNEADLNKLSRELGIDEEELSYAYDEANEYNADTINAAANILSLSTKYLWLSDMIEIDDDSVAAEIDEYISKHIHENLSVDDLCSGLHLSKGKIYSAVKTNFDDTVKNYVNRKRIDFAQMLMMSTDFSVKQISSMCGLSDYNYFSKLFKKFKKMTPSEYRKQIHRY